MKRKLAVGWFGSFIALALFLILLSATSIGAAHGADARSDGARDHEVSAVRQAPATRQPSNPLLPVLGPATIITPSAAQDLAFAMGISPSDLIAQL